MKVVLFAVIFTVVSCVKDRNALANLLEVFLLCIGGPPHENLASPRLTSTYGVQEKSLHLLYYTVISPTPVIMALLTILDHLPVQTICSHLLSHLLFLCGIAYQIMLKFLPSLLFRLMYHTSMVAIHVAFCPFVTNFSLKKVKNK